MKKQKGFSLIELLVVISIIGILTTVLVMNYVGARGRSRDSQKIQNMNTIKNALRMYYNDNQTYPETSSWVSSLVPNYLPGMDNTGIGYSQISEGDGFRLTTTLEVSAGDDDIGSQKNCGISSPEEGVYTVCAN